MAAPSTSTSVQNLAPRVGIGHHPPRRDEQHMDVAITGARGLIGSALRASLEADGHRVAPLVRPGGPGRGIAWDPVAGTIDTGGLEGLDAVVHLAGAGV